MVEIYTDGSARPNPGVGALAFVVVRNGKELYSFSQQYGNAETNNTMELRAAIKALEWRDSQFITEATYLFTDSQYVQQGITTWIHSWIENDWRTSNGKLVKNKELWEKLFSLNDPLIYFSWVRGHFGNKFNEKAHELAYNVFSKK